MKNEIRETRYKLIDIVSTINKQYLGTDDETFKKAQKNTNGLSFRGS